jgi:hypothetical protein
LHHVQGVTVVTFHEEVLAAVQFYLSHLTPERARVLVVECVEQRCPSQHSFGVVHRSSLLRALP